MKTEIKIESVHMDMGDPESISKCESMLKKMTTDGWTVIDVMFDRHLYMTTYRLEKELNAIEGYSDSELRAELTRRGYYTENLWTTVDVTGSHSCSEKEAQSILDKVMQSEWLVSNIFEMIEETASDIGVTKYPFKDGDEYWTIEEHDGNISGISSCWDDVSKEDYDANPDQLYFSTEEEVIHHILVERERKDNKQ